MLNQTFNERWIGRFGPNPWPPRSPDLTPMDFFFWGAMKEKVYFREISSLEELQEKINAVAEEMRSNLLLVNLPSEMLKRARKCIQIQGRHFEQFL